MARPSGKAKWQGQVARLSGHAEWQGQVTRPRDKAKWQGQLERPSGKAKAKACVKPKERHTTKASEKRKKKPSENKCVLFVVRLSVKSFLPVKRNLKTLQSKKLFARFPHLDHVCFLRANYATPLHKKGYSAISPSSFDQFTSDLAQVNVCLKKRPDTRLPQSHADGQGPFLRSLEHLGESTEAKDCKNIKKKV